jgi:hypothetical protein
MQQYNSLVLLSYCMELAQAILAFRSILKRMEINRFFRSVTHTHTHTHAQTQNIYIYIYRVIHKSVKHFKNSQQIDYATDHGNSYADRERNFPSFFYIFHRYSMCPHLVIRQTSMRYSISFHTRVSISRSTAILVTTVS